MTEPLHIEGTIAARRLADGRILALVPLLLNRMRITLGTDLDTYELGWCYEDNTAAMQQYLTWDPATSPEPTGWKRAYGIGVETRYSE